jgi:hypothetical protein
MNCSDIAVISGANLEVMLGKLQYMKYIKYPTNIDIFKPDVDGKVILKWIL